MGFSQASRRVRDNQRPIPQRFVAFLWCIESFAWLTGESFETTYRRLGQRFGFNWDEKPDPHRMVAALDTLTVERRGYLACLQAFDRQRKDEKAHGQRKLRRGQRRPDLRSCLEAVSKEQASTQVN
jgi:hypothetical protein